MLLLNPIASCQYAFMHTTFKLCLMLIITYELEAQCDCELANTLVLLQTSSQLEEFSLFMHIHKDRILLDVRLGVLFPFLHSIFNGNLECIKSLYLEVVHLILIRAITLQRLDDT